MNTPTYSYVDEDDIDEDLLCSHICSEPLTDPVVKKKKIISENMIASGSNDSTIRIWNIESGECVKVLEGNNNVLCSLLSLNI